MGEGGLKGYVLKDNFWLDHDRYNKYINLKNRAAQDKKYEDLRKVNEGEMSAAEDISDFDKRAK